MMNIVFKSNISLCLKMTAYDQCVLPVMTYGCETWMLNSRVLRKIQCTQESTKICMLQELTRRDHHKESKIDQVEDGLMN
jgi:hypothetical protein